MKGGKVDKRGIKDVPFASVHSLGADIVALISEDVSIDNKGQACKTFNNDHIACNKSEPADELQCTFIRVCFATIGVH